MMVENPDNEWSTNGKALSFFRFIDTILFFEAPFRGIHKWFQSDLPMIARKRGLIVRNDVFWNFRKDNSVLDELSQDFIDKCYRYKKPNVGYFWERHLSRVSRIVGDTAIQPVNSWVSSYVQERCLELGLDHACWKKLGCFTTCFGHGEALVCLLWSRSESFRYA